MHRNPRRLEATGGDGLLDPQQNVVASPPIITQIVIQTYLINLASLEQGNDLLWPTRPNPTGRRWASIIKVNFHSGANLTP
jgi:hypothetical protein